MFIGPLTQATPPCPLGQTSPVGGRAGQSWLGTVLAACVLILASIIPASAQETLLERALYREAQASLARGNLAQYRALLEQLQDYPLLPYLEYAELQGRLPSLPFEEVERFLINYQQSYLAERLERQWVDLLAKRQRWGDVLRYHRPENSSPELRCHVLRARQETGDISVYYDVADMWNVAVSQPNACDPVFNTWLAVGFLPPHVGWERFSKTLRAGHLNLARYIAHQLPPREAELADRYLEVQRRPERLRDLADFQSGSPEMQEIVLHGLELLSRIDGQVAMELWNHYRRQYPIPVQQALALERGILLRLLLQGQTAAAEARLVEQPILITPTLAEWLLRDALRQQDWPRIQAWLARLPAETAASERWQYWQARALLENGGDPAQARAIHARLAEERSYYGFLSADLLGLPYALRDRPVAVSEARLQQVEALPALQRARELYALGDDLDARREWQHAMTRLDQEGILAAGKLADSWGWYRQGIQAMIRASYWDDLQLRFPLAYSELVATAADELRLPPQLLFAIARQESAFMEDVRSPAGALGLMQLMPGTARQTARTLGLQITHQDLLRPELNLVLGSRYLAELLEDFKGNRVLAAAAYNAGPNRVKQWLQDNGEMDLPLDMWVETMPLAETRNYVQNVLAYAVIYSQRLGQPAPLLSEEEMAAGPSGPSHRLSSTRQRLQLAEAGD